MLESIQAKEEKFILTVIIGIPLITLCLLGVIKKDAVFLVIVMALCISLIIGLNFIYSRIVGDSIYYWSAVLFGYTIVLGLTVLLKKWIYFFKTNEVSRQEKSVEKLNSILILTTLIYTMVVGGFYASSEEFWQVLVEGEFIKSVGIIFGFLLVIFLLGKTASIQHLQQSTKRKMFHLGPIIVTPIVYSINIKILVLILTAASFVFLALEVIRYVLKEINLTKKNQDQQQHQQKENSILRLLISFFKLMEAFNSRQPHFWFTHLFLIMSLQLSYNIELVTGRQGLGHVVLIMIAADAMAAIVGKSLGRIKISSKKTLQGLIAFVVTAYLLLKLLQRFYRPLSGNYDLLIAFGCGFVQLWSGNADNVTTLLVFWVINLSTQTSIQM